MASGSDHIESSAGVWATLVALLGMAFSILCIVVKLLYWEEKYPKVPWKKVVIVIEIHMIY